MDTSSSAARYVSIRLNPVGRVHTFLLEDDGAPLPRAGEPLIVRTDSGPALAAVVPLAASLAARRSALPTVQFVRRATGADLEQRDGQTVREADARRVALLKIQELRLEMKLSRVEQVLDGSKLIFYFTAEGRIDFRELVRQLAGELRTRIEMRQVGVRDEARMLGGYGSCGRPLCCTTWLQSFEPVSIKMAKQQALALNPSKLSGLCGRLKCCLRYELPNAKGELHGGCGGEGGCDNPTGCGTGGGCASGQCSCGKR